jgi:iduronate 2-sulfatase
MMRNFLWMTFVLQLSLVLGAAAAASDRPNVLFIAIDDLNDWIGAMEGHPQAKTPNLDRLFARGTLFTNAHTASPVCNPSRHATMTGLHPVKTGWYGSVSVDEIGKTYEEVLGDRLPMPTFFRQHGYRTLAAGKIFHRGVQDFDYPYWDEAREADYGFSADAISRSHFAPYPQGRGAIAIKHGGRRSGSTLAWEALEDERIPAAGMPDEQLADWAVRQLEGEQHQPFFLAVGFLRPHVPFTAPKRFFDAYPLDAVKVPEVPEDEMQDIPLYGKAMAYGTLPLGDHREVLDLSPTYWAELVRAYLACITFVDEQVGRVIDALDASEYAENTIIVLWSDHGQHLGEKKHWRKQALWEEATRVPLFLSYPGMPQRGVRNDSPVSLIDVFPTLSALAGLPEQALDGVSLRHLLDDPDAERGRPVLSTRYPRNHAVRTQDWRYIRYRDGAEELYDHRVDPGEHVNLATDPAYADIIEAHRKYLPSANAFPVGEDHFPEDVYDRRVKQFKEEGVPLWLNP